MVGEDNSSLYTLSILRANPKQPELLLKEIYLILIKSAVNLDYELL